MNIRDRRFRGRQQIERSQRIFVQSFLNGVSLVNKLGELPDTHHAITADNVGR